MADPRLDDPRIKNDIVRVIAQYLEDEGYTGARTVLLDEAGIREASLNQQGALVAKIASAITGGSWDEAVALTGRLAVSLQRDASIESEKLRALVFAIHKQHFLELLDRREVQLAFTLLNNRVKPSEHTHAGGASEIRDLAYALTCQSVQEVEAFADWDVITARARLVEQLRGAVGVHLPPLRAQDDALVPPQRLRTLLLQAVAHQVDALRLGPTVGAELDTLLTDVRAVVVPNALRATLEGHTDNVKSVAFDRLRPSRLLSGSSDGTVRAWDVLTGREVTCLTGHRSRVWEVDSTPLTGRCLSASADGTVRVWDVDTGACCASIVGHESDVYTVRAHPGGAHCVSGGYDRTVRLHDVATAATVRVLEGHELGVSRALFNNYGNLILSGSKDCRVKLWDVASGLCVMTFGEHFAEISGLDVNDAGDQLLVATKSNTNILVDMRMNRVLRRFRGHQNSTLHFVGARFGPAPGLLTGGSEDGRAVVWSMATGEIVQSLDGHDGAVYATAWSDSQAMMATCSADETVKLWEFRPPVDAAADGDAGAGAGAAAGGAAPGH